MEDKFDQPISECEKLSGARGGDIRGNLREIRAVGPTGRCPRNPEELAGNVAHDFAQELSVAEDLPPDRSKMVDDFVFRCNQESPVGFTVRRKHIWLAAGHAQARQFQCWQRRSDKATGADERNFRRILGMNPGEFIALLRRKGILAEAHDFSSRILAFPRVSSPCSSPGEEGNPNGRRQLSGAGKGLYEERAS